MARTNAPTVISEVLQLLPYTNAAARVELEEVRKKKGEIERGMKQASEAKCTRTCSDKATHQIAIASRFASGC